LERRVRLDREDDDVRVADHVLVAAPLDAEFLGRRACAVGVARADDDVVLAELGQTLGERAPERAGAADDRNSHARATAFRAASASSRRAVASRISVLATIGRTPSSATASASAASASSSTSASIRPA